MFGHQDDQKDDGSQHDNTAVQSIAPEPHTHDAPEDDGSAGQDDQAQPSPMANPDENNAQAPSDASSDDTAWQHPGEPLEGDPTDADTDAGDSGQISDIIAPAGGGHASTLHPSTPSHSFTAGSGSANDDADTSQVPHELIDIKQKALGQLSPIINQLDQTPEDRFRTLMMMIQASDDQKLIKEAYEAANAIEDEKIKGQALIDIVNEINYFTQHPQPEN